MLNQLSVVATMSQQTEKSKGACPELPLFTIYNPHSLSEHACKQPKKVWATNTKCKTPGCPVAPYKTRRTDFLSRSTLW